LRRAESFYTSPFYIKTVYQRIDGLTGIFAGFGSQMCVSGGCQYTDMAKDFLKFNEVNAPFEQMGGKTVA